MTATVTNGRGILGGIETLVRELRTTCERKCQRCTLVGPETGKYYSVNWNLAAWSVLRISAAFPLVPRLGGFSMKGTRAEQVLF